MTRACFLILLFLFPLNVIANSNEKFVLQILEPTGGKIEKPVSWFYEERHRSARSLSWVISKEEPTNGYETGLAIQLMVGIQDKTKMTPAQFVKNHLNAVAKAAISAKACEPESIGFFIRQCLELEEEKVVNGKVIQFHVLYSFFWNDDTDMVGVTVAGSPSDSWSKYQGIFERMSKIDLIDMDRFKE
ncbi:hypothetical protein [Aliikangiella coralliicola]|uniref:DUF1795 domain-containing protein n=1 Tax=Aliikangiella coralliicola TaxID=2592383 RepID=A0A545UC86_9GAMM|nr:hypothetical protein [Aliikangiella coralliicola]TQV87076.1 hypothetical protein FLL46_14825 [Aliikangiella coralliicola]